MSEGDKEALIAEVKVGWLVEITNHDYLADSREAKVTSIHDGTLTLTPKRPWFSQGRKFTTTTLTWDGVEVTGRTAYAYRVSKSITSRSAKVGEKRLIKEYKFTPPTD